MNRNESSYFTNLPKPTLPRHRHVHPVVNDLVSFKHGRLVLVNARIVYPDSTWQREATELIQMDTSNKVPLDDVVLDTYDFFIPFRIIDKDFEKILGAVEPYDTNQYFFPELELDFDSSHPLTHDTILNGAGWRAAVNQLFDYDSNIHGWVPKSGMTSTDKINPYPLMAYYKVYTDFFRDENVDPSIPYEDLKGGKLSTLSSLFNNLEALPVNKLHDPFTSCLISPQKQVNGLSRVTIPLGTAAPVYTGPVAYTDAHPALSFRATDGGSIAGQYGDLDVHDSQAWFHGKVADTGGFAIYPNNLYADLTQATGASIDALRINFAIQQYAEVKAKFGSRMIEHYAGVWGLAVPDYLLDRPEYLGGHRCTLSNVAVLNQANLLGTMSGFSNTVTPKSSWTKTFLEYGVLIRVACTRVHHIYSQGRQDELLGLKDELDLYNRFFANIGNIPVKNKLIYNKFDEAANEQNFAYQESWWYLRTAISTGAGDFGANHGDSSELYTQWSYQDIYTTRPYFSANWLKEDPTNVQRTLTARTIPNATNDYGHQYMAAFIRQDKVTMPLPSHPIPAGLVNRI